MYPLQFSLLNYHPFSPLETMNKKDQNVENNEKIKRDREDEEEEEEEEKKIDTFFKLIKNYQEARKRRRGDLAENSDNVRKRSKSVVPAFQPGDFSRCGTDLKPLMTVSDQKEESITKVKEEEEEEEEAEKKVKEEKDFDLNLAL